jgi:hypothetical protein
MGAGFMSSTKISFILSVHLYCFMPSGNVHGASPAILLLTVVTVSSWNSVAEVVQEHCA